MDYLEVIFSYLVFPHILMICQPFAVIFIRGSVIKDDTKRFSRAQCIWIVINYLVLFYEVFFLMVILWGVNGRYVSFGVGIGLIIYVFSVGALAFIHFLVLSTFVFKFVKSIYFVLLLVLASWFLIQLHLDAAEGNSSNNYGLDRGTKKGLYYTEEQIERAKRQIEQDKMTPNPSMNSVSPQEQLQVYFADSRYVDNQGFLTLNECQIPDSVKVLKAHDVTLLDKIMSQAQLSSSLNYPYKGNIYSFAYLSPSNLKESPCKNVMYIYVSPKMDVEYLTKSSSGANSYSFKIYDDSVKKEILSLIERLREK